MLILALGLGLWLRLWFIAHGPRVTGDSLVYGDIARNWLLHGVYGFTKAAETIRPTLIRLPGYPLYLALCFRLYGMEHYGGAMKTQAVLDLLTCLLIAATAGRLFGRRALWIALWLAVLCPFTANYVAAALTETLSLFCIAAAFYSMVRWRDAGMGWTRWIAGIGLALAYAVLLRPEQGLLAAAVIPTMAWMVWTTHKKLAPVLCAAVLVVLPLVPWTARNWHTFHTFQPLAPRQANDPGEHVPIGFNRWFRTWGVDFISTDQVYWHYDSDPILITTLPNRAFDSADEKQRTATLLDDYNRTTTASAAFDTRFEQIGEDRIRAGRLRYFVWMPSARLANMLFRPRTELLNLPLDWWNRGPHWLNSAALAALNFLYFASALWGLWRWGLRDGISVAMLAFCLLRCALLLTIDNSEPRYTLELFPILIVWAARAFASSSDASPSRPSR